MPAKMGGAGLEPGMTSNDAKIPISSRLRSSKEAAYLLAFWFTCTTVLACPLFIATPAEAQELKYPQVIKIRYEALDPDIGGQFIIWVEREKIWYGLDPRLYPAAKSVEVTHVTPAPGSTTLTTIAVTKVKSSNPDYFHLSGNVRFKISGMTVTSTNAP